MSKEIDDMIVEALRTYRSRVYTINIQDQGQQLSKFLTCGRKDKVDRVPHKYNQRFHVITPKGEFPTVKAAALMYGVCEKTMVTWIANKEGFNYEDKK